MGIYRPPNNNVDTAIDIISSELDKITPPNNPVILMGDINVDNLVESEETRNLNGILTSYNIHRLHLPPTRITTHSQTSIDFIFTNTNDSEISSEVIQTGLSDHTAQNCKITIEKKNHSTTQQR